MYKDCRTILNMYKMSMLRPTISHIKASSTHPSRSIHKE